MKIERYELSNDEKGLRGFFEDGSFYHIHSDELTGEEAIIRESLIHKF